MENDPQNMFSNLPSASGYEGSSSNNAEIREETTPLLSKFDSNPSSLLENMVYYNSPAHAVTQFQSHDEAEGDSTMRKPQTTSPFINANDSSSLHRRYWPFQPSKRQMSVAHGSIVFGLILFIALILSVLVRLPSFSLFSYHPTFMTAFLVCITEGVALLQPTPATVETKQKGFRWHLLVQVLGSGCLLIGFLCIFYNKQLHNKPHFQSFHGQMGLTIFIYVWLQAIFGVIMALIPRYVFGSVERGKQLWKYHRMTGYVLLLVVWITAQLGVRTDYMLANLINTNLLYLHWIVLVLVIAGLFYRFRIHKIGF